MSAERVGRQISLTTCDRRTEDSVELDEVRSRADCSEHSQPLSVFELTQRRMRHVRKHLCLHHLDELVPLCGVRDHERAVESGWKGAQKPCEAVDPGADPGPCWRRRARPSGKRSAACCEASAVAATSCCCQQQAPVIEVPAAQDADLASSEEAGSHEHLVLTCTMSSQNRRLRCSISDRLINLCGVRACQMPSSRMSASSTVLSDPAQRPASRSN